MSDPLAPAPAPAPASAPAHSGAPRLRQPLLGFAGLVLILVVVTLVGILPTPERIPLQVIGPITVFWFPLLVALATWPRAAHTGGTRRSTAASAAVATVGSLVAGVVLTAIAQVLIGRLDLAGLFSTVEETAKGTLTAFPFTLTLGMLVAVTMLQIAWLWGGWPLRRLASQTAGWAALGVSWLVAVAVYFLLVNWDSVPAEIRSSIGLRSPGGPWDGTDLLALLFTMAMWQAILGVIFQGQPFAAFRSTGARVWASTAWVVLLSAVTYLIWRHGVHFPNGAVVGIGGAGTAAALLTGFLLGRWPFQREAAGAARGGVLITAVVVTPTIYFFLRASGNESAVPPVGLWIGVCGIGFISALILLHVHVWRRWPFPTEATDAEPSPAARPAGAPS